MKLAYIVSVGFVEDEVMKEVQMLIGQSFGFHVNRLEGRPCPSTAFDSARGQWSAVEFMRDLVLSRPPDAVRILGLTSSDLFIPMLSFLFGQAQLNGFAALVSTARLRQEFYGLPKNRELLIARVRKETLHELGHTFGLLHCPDRSCVMSLSTNLEQVDTKLERYCRHCTLGVQACLETLFSDDQGM